MSCVKSWHPHLLKSPSLIHRCACFWGHTSMKSWNVLSPPAAGSYMWQVTWMENEGNWCRNLGGRDSKLMVSWKSCSEYVLHDVLRGHSWNHYRTLDHFVLQRSEAWKAWKVSLTYGRPASSRKRASSSAGTGHLFGLPCSLAVSLDGCLSTSQFGRRAIQIWSISQKQFLLEVGLTFGVYRLRWLTCSHYGARRCSARNSVAPFLGYLRLWLMKWFVHNFVPQPWPCFGTQDCNTPSTRRRQRVIEWRACATLTAQRWGRTKNSPWPWSITSMPNRIPGESTFFGWMGWWMVSGVILLYCIYFPSSLVGDEPEPRQKWRSSSNGYLSNRATAGYKPLACNRCIAICNHRKLRSPTCGENSQRNREEKESKERESQSKEHQGAQKGR